MKRKSLTVSCFLALLVCAATVGVNSTTHAQTRDKYLISVKAGGINFVTGNVTVERGGTGGQQQVTDQDNLDNGDRVTTGLSGRVEVLLNPGSYLRVAENSELEMTDTSLEHLRIKLLRGSAIIEVVGTDDTQLSLQVDTPHTTAVVVRRGIYRFNVLQSGATEVLVRKGRALVGPTALVVKSGKMVVVNRGSMSEVTKIDKRDKDSLELWSRDRAEYLASINRSVAPGIVDVGTDLWASYNDRYSGAWAYDSRRACYVFLPGRGGSSSPYGYGYDNCRCSGGDRRNETPRNVPPGQPGGNNSPVAGVPPPDGTPVAPTDGGQPREPGGSFRPSEPREGNRPVSESPTPVNRPEPPTPVSRPEPESAPAPSAPSAPSQSDSQPPSSPPPSAPPPSEPVRSEAPARAENPND
jgi:hypothetical protein